MKVNLLITGPPGVGKSSLVNQIVREARERNLMVGGIITPEQRVLMQGKNVRVGFFIVNLLSNEQDFLAKADLKSEYRVGKYGVILENIKSIGVRAIREAIQKANLIVIDEIGKMELLAPEFAVAVREAFDSPKPVLGTIGKNVQHPFVEEIKRRRDVEIINLTRNNREMIYKRIFSEIIGAV
ncbi:MAG: NTPase [Candidatus Freyarchaeota archaeon]